MGAVDVRDCAVGVLVDRDARVMNGQTGELLVEEGAGPGQAVLDVDGFEARQFLVQPERLGVGTKKATGSRLAAGQGLALATLAEDDPPAALHFQVAGECR